METDRPQADGVKKNATIYDVADAAGVAVGTVSRYLNGHEVRRGNRDLIEAAIEKLAFQRNAAARAIKAERTDIIGFMVPTFDEFHADLLDNLARSFQQTGRRMLTYCHDGDTKILREAMGFFANQRVDALVMAGQVESAEDVRTLVERDIPVLIYNNDVAGLNVDKIFVENLKASKRAVQHLIEVGHRRIAVVHGRLQESSAAQRLEGYREAIVEGGLSLRDDYVVPGGWSVEGGYSAIERLMDLAEPPTAVFSSNYRMTIGMLEWAREHAKSVPGDFSILSFDDVELFRLYDGGITAIAQPISKIADTIINYAISRVTESDLPAIRTRTLDCNIVLRASSRLSGTRP